MKIAVIQMIYINRTDSPESINNQTDGSQLAGDRKSTDNSQTNSVQSVDTEIAGRDIQTKKIFGSWRMKVARCGPP